MVVGSSIASSLTAIVVGLLVIGAPTLVQTDAPKSSPEPANKTSVAGSSVEIFSPGEVVTLLSTTMRTSAPTDLVIAVTLECSLLTQVTTVGNDLQHAQATVEVWVEIDGAPVQINPDEAGEDDGRVVFCDRLHEKETTLFDDENATIRDYLRTRTANAFNWIHMDAGSGIHQIEVRATMETDTSARGVAEAGVGKRTLVVEPFKFANGETLSN